jgi:hypothetical protein
MAIPHAGSTVDPIEGNSSGTDPDGKPGVLQRLATGRMGEVVGSDTY